MFTKLELGRKIKVDPERKAYISTELHVSNYTQQNALRAEYWLIWGDWTMKGTDPTLTIDDFYPTEQQYRTGYERRHMQRMPSTANDNRQRTIEEFEDYKRRYIKNDGFMH